ncbi:GntR family transcriptional regulator [Spirochaetota bacterium]
MHGNNDLAEFLSSTLRERVYEYLKQRLNNGDLKPGAFLDLHAIGKELGYSRTPLRDALLRLEAEGFVTIHARRGVLINTLEIQTIRNSYQIVGSLEAAAILEASTTFTEDDARHMLELNDDMADFLSKENFDAYYRANLAFHAVYVSLSRNIELKRIIRIHKDRLYDFPRKEGYLRQWETESIKEHDTLARLLLAKNYMEAAVYTRDVHWSFTVQERFIMSYYFAREAALGPVH